MYPYILEDLVKGAQAAKSSDNLSRQNALLTLRHKVDSTRIVGLNTTVLQQNRRIEALIDSSGRGWQMAEYWRKRYKKASAERWLWRGGAATLIYFKLKQP